MSNHFVSISDVSRGDIERFFSQAQMLTACDDGMRARILEGHVLGIMFYQTSTRTRLSFETAMLKLGGKVTGFSDFKQTRAGDFFAESLDDTVRIVAGMVDCIVLRHYSDGAAVNAANVSPVPVINAGDGSNEHPTQALCDLWTIRKRFGQIDGLKIALVGDPGCRVTRSMLNALVKFDVKKIYFICPPTKAVLTHQTELLAAAGVAWEVLSGMAEAIDVADVIWMIPFLLPDFHSASPSIEVKPHLEDRFILTKKKVLESGRTPFIVHTGPRGEELDSSLDCLENCCYFRQAEDAIQVRMALLANLMTPDWEDSIDLYMRS